MPVFFAPPTFSLDHLCGQRLTRQDDNPWRQTLPLVVDSFIYLLGLSRLPLIHTSYLQFIPPHHTPTYILPIPPSFLVSYILRTRLLSPSCSTIATEKPDLRHHLLHPSLSVLSASIPCIVPLHQLPAFLAINRLSMCTRQVDIASGRVCQTDCRPHITLQGVNCSESSLAIHIDMTEHQYLPPVVSHPDGLSLNATVGLGDRHTSSAPPPGAAYADSYSTVS
jgi:hypothetical protein